MPVIEFKNATKQYGNRLVLDNVNLQIQGGDWVWLMGASGAGKTTLVHALIGAVPLSKGDVLVDGYNVTKFNRLALQEYRRKLGIVFQDYKLLPKKTAYENVAIPTAKSNDESLRSWRRLVWPMQDTISHICSLGEKNSVWPLHVL
jgi:ABC-type ATPase involved in cell division